LCASMSTFGGFKSGSAVSFFAFILDHTKTAMGISTTPSRIVVVVAVASSKTDARCTRQLMLSTVAIMRYSSKRLSYGFSRIRMQPNPMRVAWSQMCQTIRPFRV
jgi:hypothetical protein